MNFFDEKFSQLQYFHTDFFVIKDATGTGLLDAWPASVLAIDV
jgi:hypothetical protein